MALVYRYPAPEVVEEADAVRIRQVTVDLEGRFVSVEYVILTPEGDVALAATREIGLGAWNNFINNAGAFPGATFEEKILSQQAVTQLIPGVPSGGTVEDESA